MAETYLKAAGLSKRYGHIAALREVDLEAERGSCVVLLGPNGAGKSTLLGIIAGRTRPTGGRVVISGTARGDRGSPRLHTGYLAHDSLLYGGLTARENLLFYGELYGVKDADRRSDEMLQFMGLWDRRNDSAGGFSRGMQQRLAIARSLLHDPELILLDEPFSGLDHQSSRAFRRALEQLRDGHRTLLMATHDLTAVQDLGDKVVIMDRGRVLYEGAVPGGPPDAVRELYTATLTRSRS